MNTDDQSIRACEALPDTVMRHVWDDPTGELLMNVAAAQRRPTDPMPLYRIADICRELGDVAAWRDAVSLASRRDHRSYEQLYFRGRAKRLLGDWSGWSDYEVRFFGPMFHEYHTPRAREMRFKYRSWDGEEAIRDKVLLVCADQGPGATIQTLRYLPAVVEIASSVIVSVEPRLRSFVTHNFADSVQVASEGSDAQLEFDRYIWAMSLPAVIGYLPRFAPLTAPHAQPRPRRHMLNAGICLSDAVGSESAGSVPPVLIEALLDRYDVEWMLLHVGDKQVDATGMHNLKMPRSAPARFGDLADVIDGLDYVVSVDTAIAHLAASLAVPTFLLLPTDAHWRWGLGQSTPWYPTMRILRQETPRDWRGVLDSLQQRLDDFTRASAQLMT